ncbi:MAG: ABC transporter permease [Cyanobacteria bacterium J06635_15]
MLSPTLQTKAQTLIAQRREAGIDRAIADSLTITWRNLIRLSRLPAVIVSVVLFPVIFLSGFLLSFQRLMAGQGIDYVQYLLPIITLQAMFFAAMGAAVALANDMESGMVQRCRAMPISRIAILGGLVLAYLVRAVIATAILLTFAHVYGFRFQTGILSILGYFALTLLFTATMVMGYAVFALKLRQPALVNALLIVPYTPLLLLSTGFSPADNFPVWLQPVVSLQPVSRTADALRALANGTDLLVPALWAVGWLVGLLLLLSAIAVRLYRQVS